MAGWIIYKLTTQPALGATIVCLKFGLDDFKTGYWLWRRDAKPTRGRACFWFYLTWGLLKIVWICYFALFTAILVSGYARHQGLLPGLVAEPIPKIKASLITLGVSLLVASLSGLIAIVTAWRGGARIWLDSDIHEAGWQNHWPPARFSTNKASTMLAGTACGSALAVFVPGAVAFFLHLREADLVAKFLGAVVVGAIGIAAVAVGYRVHECLRAAIVAETPASCWEAIDGQPCHWKKTAEELDQIPAEHGTDHLL